MTDRELLEMAARAAGLGEVWYLEGSATPYIGPRYEPGQKIGYSVWTPLTDDGDALRLAVKLDLLIDVCVVSGGIRATRVLWSACGPSRITEEHGSDPYAATRRAIVRAAAMAKED